MGPTEAVYTSGALNGVRVGGNRDRMAFAENVERAEKLADQLDEAVRRIDQRISGRAETQAPETGNVPRALPPLETTAERTVLVLERALEVVQRIAGDVGALG